MQKRWLEKPGNLEKKRAYARKAAQKARLKDPERIRRNKKNSEFRLKKLVFEYYCGGSAKCQCCGENNLLFLTLDHTNNDGAKHRRAILKQDYPDRKKRGDLTGRQFYAWLKRNAFPDIAIKVLCFNCNCGKMTNLGICPHKGNMHG